MSNVGVAKIFRKEIAPMSFRPKAEALANRCSGECQTAQVQMLVCDNMLL